jgi:hypothetical protein
MRVLSRCLPHSLSGAVGAVIVDDKDLQRVDTALAQKRCYGRTNYVHFIASRNDDGDHELGPHLRERFHAVMQ